MSSSPSAHAALPRLRLHTLWLALGWCFVGAVVYFSLTPDVPRLAQRVWDKANHFSAYAWLMWWFAQVHARLASRVRAALALTALGVALEILQGLGAARQAQWADALANTLGVGAGFALALTPLGATLRWAERCLLGRAG
jgi:VanZ family protein